YRRDLGVGFRLRTRRYAGNHPVEDLQHMPPLLLAQAVAAIRIVTNGLTDHHTLGLLQARRSPPQPYNRLVVEREGHLDHSTAILPYRWLFQALLHAALRSASVSRRGL